MVVVISNLRLLRSKISTGTFIATNLGERDANVGTSGINEYNNFTLARIVRQTVSDI